MSLNHRFSDLQNGDHDGDNPQTGGQKLRTVTINFHSHSDAHEEGNQRGPRVCSLGCIDSGAGEGRGGDRGGVREVAPDR
jgi:hypothetical protein